MNVFDGFLARRNTKLGQRIEKPGKAQAGDLGALLLRDEAKLVPTHRDRHYTYRVSWSEEDNEFVGTCVEFPSLSWLDKKQEKALKGIRKLVFDCLHDMKKNHEAMPEP